MIVDWHNKVVTVFKDDMLQIQSTPVEIRQLDINDFHNELHLLQESEDGIVKPDIHQHVPPKTVSGVILARVVEVINDYTITFEDGNYNVNVVGGNSNISDRTNKNTVGVNTANSAGLQDLTSLQAASFGGVVTIDKQNGVAGTFFPIGTAGSPVNNVADARAIMSKNNISTLQILGNVTLTQGDDVSNIIVKGINPTTSVLMVESGAITNNAYIRELYFTGTLNGGSILRDCSVGEMNYQDGYLEHCALTSATIYVNGNAVLANCFAGSTCTSAPIIDLTNSTGIAIRDYSGNIKITNKATSTMCQIGLTGVLEIDETITNGTFEVYGDAKIINNATGSFVLEDNTTGTPKEIAKYVWDNETRSLTVAATSSLTQEQHDQLMKTATKADVLIASQL